MSEELDARAIQIAYELIDFHGDEVSAYLHERISQLIAAGDTEQVSAWVIIRKAVALLLNADGTLH
jgi:hypothetical protein